MAEQFGNPNRNPGQSNNSTPITFSQRSSCNLVFYHWDDRNITKLSELSVANANPGLAPVGQAPFEGNLLERRRTIIRNDVIRCSVSKAKSASSGTFTITLKRGKVVINGQPQPRDINYLDVIHPGDWVMIYLKKSGSINIESTNANSGLKSIGIVENVRYVEIDDAETGKPRLEYIVTGRDFGKVFESDVFFNPLINQNTARAVLGVNFLYDENFSVKGRERPITANAADPFSPDRIVRKLVSFYLGSGRDNDGTQNLSETSVTNQPWYIPSQFARRFFPNGIEKRHPTISDIINLDKIGLQKYINGALNSVSQLPGQLQALKALPSSGTVWSILQFFQNSAVNELYTELIPDNNNNLKPTLVLRQYPFSNKTNHETNAFTADESFDNNNFLDPVRDIVPREKKTFLVDLPRFEIVSSDIKEKNIGKSDFERINHILVVPRGDTKNFNSNFIAYVNTPSVQRHGVQSLQRQSIFVNDSTQNRIGDFRQVCRYYTSLMTDWFFLNHLLYNGSIVIDGVNQHVQIGTNLYIRDIQQLFHIEGCNHIYNQSPDGVIDYSIELTVTRGQFFDTAKASFISASNTPKEPTTIVTSVLEGIR